jgi:hypothetical protein
MRGSFFLGLLTALATTATLFALTGYQITSEQAATRLLGRLAAALVEIDRWLPAHQEDLKLLARDRPQGSIPAADLPIAISLPAGEVAEADEAQLRALIVRVAGDALYADGTEALRDIEGNPASLGIDEPVRWTTGLLSKGMHSLWQIVLLICVLVLLLLAGAVFVNDRRPFLPIAAGGFIGAAGSFAAWIGAVLIAPAFEGAIDREIMLIARDGAWVGLRNSLAVAIAAIAILVIVNALRHERRYAPMTSSPPEAGY